MLELLFLAFIFAIPSTAHAEDPQVVMESDFQHRPVNPGPAIGVLIQTWAFEDTTAPVTNFDFRIRRAELRARGTAGNEFRWYLMADAAKALKTGPVSASNDNKILQDALVAYSPAPGLELYLGQFKIPTTAESLEGSPDIILPERSLVARTWGDVREPGAQLTWKTGDLQLMGMVSNGHGTNVDDTDSEKDAHLRAVYSPAKDMRVGAFTTAGNSGYSSKGRWGANVAAGALGGFARAEAVTANDSGARSWGFVADAGYPLASGVMPVARFDFLNAQQGGTSATSLGLDWYAAREALIRVSWSYLYNQSTNAGANQVSYGSFGSLLILDAQARF